MNFSEALNSMKQGERVSRHGWNSDDINLEIQTPDEHSKMTKPYIYMNKRGDKFPCDPSCESVLANDWYIVVQSKKEHGK